MVGENGERCVMLFGVNIAAKPCKIDDTRNNDSINICENENNRSSDEQEDDDESDDDKAIDMNDNTDSGQSSNHENIRKVKAWTKKEHQAFLVGLQKYGKGKWKDISRKYVKTKTSTQVASHAQKYFLRRTTKTKRRSVFDMILDYEDLKDPGDSPSPGPSPNNSP